MISNTNQNIQYEENDFFTQYNDFYSQVDSLDSRITRGKYQTATIVDLKEVETTLTKLSEKVNNLINQATTSNNVSYIEAINKYKKTINSNLFTIKSLIAKQIKRYNVDPNIQFTINSVDNRFAALKEKISRTLSQMLVSLENNTNQQSQTIVDNQNTKSRVIELEAELNQLLGESHQFIDIKNQLTDLKENELRTCKDLVDLN